MNKTQALVFFGIIIVGLAISLFTLNKCGNEVEVVENEDPKGKTVEPGKTDPKGTGPQKGVTPEKGKGPNTPDTPPATAGLGPFTSPEALMGALSKSVKNRDAETFLKVAGPNSVSPLVQAQVTRLIRDPNFLLDESKPFVQLAKGADSS
ncbi:MAG: hypothetical protein HKN23_19975, partial [Verrucomicrobiales bacterium]|nr:hypothetical protein [Verrucomicrobiales bacterium]